ncbi:MAG: Hsp20/alpha crystallin family protein [Candidatus Heimdallarchaeota archaeon]|nr:Hsp20/alpha crystallin family protein [Candidatus Heimdallarchaeota archaeon]MCK4954307.1 Hsp20/alpha crystallin family protein [Candidatus Heimdallarchaeota archaeon]
MNTNDNDDEKKKKKKESDDSSFPFDFFSSWENVDIEDIMGRFAPYFRGSSFGKMIDEMLKNIMKNLEDVDSSSFEDIAKNPFVYGFKVGVGPDGRPDFSQFGNLKSKSYGDIESSDVREPLIDVFKEDDDVRVIAEVPGVNKGDIMLTGSERTLTIKAHSQSRKYEKSVSLPVPVDIETAKAKYKNGVLEVVISRKESKKDRDFDIEVS